VKRAPFVIGATGAGLGLVLTFHTKPLHVNNIVASPGSGTAGNSGSTTTGPVSVPSTTTPGATPTTTPVPTTTQAARSATGQDVTYRYGDLQLRVIEKASKITDIQVIAEGATDPRSEEINSQAVPLLRQEAMSAQSANIDGVSGATFTSQAYAQAMQSALDQLG
jgi:uncharacterized protein with FMN-binding domain